MKTLKIIVSGGKDHYGAWAEDVKGIYGVGSTIEEVKENIKEAIELFIECNEDIPKILEEDYILEFVFDASGLIKYYSQYLTLPAMEKITGINQKQLWHYANGYKKPRIDTSEKIEKGFVTFAKQMESKRIAV